MNIVAGQELYAKLQAEKAARVAKAGEFYSSEPLCEWQRDVSRRGIVGAEIVESMYGWSVRYDSGLQNWASCGRPEASRQTSEPARRQSPSASNGSRKTRPIATLGRGTKGVRREPPRVRPLRQTIRAAGHA